MQMAFGQDTRPEMDEKKALAAQPFSVLQYFLEPDMTSPFFIEIGALENEEVCISGGLDEPIEPLGVAGVDHRPPVDFDPESKAELVACMTHLERTYDSRAHRLGHSRLEIEKMDRNTLRAGGLQGVVGRSEITDPLFEPWRPGDH